MRSRQFPLIGRLKPSASYLWAAFTKGSTLTKPRDQPPRPLELSLTNAMPPSWLLLHAQGQDAQKAETSNHPHCIRNILPKTLTECHDASPKRERIDRRRQLKRPTHHLQGVQCLSPYQHSSSPTAILSTLCRSPIRNRLHSCT